MLSTIKGYILSNHKKLTANRLVVTSTTNLQSCGCCDNWCRRCLQVDFLFPELIGNEEKQHSVYGAIL